MQIVVAGKDTALTDSYYADLKNLSDEELFELSLQSNYEAFELLVKRYEDRIYRLGLKMLRSPEDAEDLLQKTFLSVFEKMDQFRGESSVSTWIFRIATNHALMKLRKDKGKNIDSLDAPVYLDQDALLPQVFDETTDVVEYYERKELLEKLEQGLQQLPEIYRLVFILRDVEGFSNKEVAKMLNLSIPAVKSRILRARINLRDYLADSQGKEVGEL
jgi:RNA polymerase sigma-70 factor, ECF subfamily